MKKLMIIMIDKNDGKAMLGNPSNLGDKVGKTKERVIYAANHGTPLCTMGKGVYEVYMLGIGYTFYTREGRIVAENKIHSVNKEKDETGYSLAEIKMMMTTGYDGLKAKKVLFPIYENPEFPKDLYEEFKDENIIRYYRREGYEWKEYFI